MPERDAAVPEVPCAVPEVPCVGAVVHDAAGRLLLIQRGHAPSAGLWSVPGGRVEPGETEPDAVVRETHEETGLRVRPVSVAGRVRIPGDGVLFTVTDWRCDLAGEGQRPVAGDDAAAVAFVDAAGLAALEAAGRVAPGVVAALTGWGLLPHR
ncbi:MULTISPECIES: NUDIX domain-containing protein [unclassified Modestobacter]